MTTLDKFIIDQLSVWPEAASRFRTLKQVDTVKYSIRGLDVTLQYNKDRIVSSAAKTDDSSLKARPCFLCACNRPDEQKCVKFEGRRGHEYSIVLNPFPIFPKHLIVTSEEHTPQSIWHRFGDMADLAHHYMDFTFFYNGPHGGASAPDHFHFQACPKGLMSLEKTADDILSQLHALHADDGVPNGEEVSDVPDNLQDEIEFVASVQDAQLYHYKRFTTGVFFLRARTSKSMSKLFYRLLDCAPLKEGETEPRFNLYTWYSPTGDSQRRPSGYTHGMADFEYRSIVVFRSEHRSHHYFSEGDDHLVMSPGCADMGGTFIAARREDFDKMNKGLLTEVIDEVSVSKEVESGIIWRLTRRQPLLEVGIMWGDKISFEIISDGAGKQTVSYQEGKINYNGTLYDSLFFEARTVSTLFAQPSFILHDVLIGENFHWERRRDETFAGSLKFIVENGKVVAVNCIGVEDYLLSVISSEMKPTATVEFLKAHAVISRSWVMSQIRHRHATSAPVQIPEGVRDLPSVVTHVGSVMNYTTDASEDSDTVEVVRWFDHEDHKLYDVCADDHCQRYQGLTMVISDNARKVIDETWGEVLTSEGEICDARFAKCCGGKSDVFSTCWGDKDYPYLKSLPDTPDHDPDAEPFCKCNDKDILSQVLNDYDYETEDFFSWKEEYTKEELSQLIISHSGVDIGEIVNMSPVEVGPSGRIIKLRIEGTKKTLIVAKELMIRRYLSTSHLKSSAFRPLFSGNKVTLEGIGWGHGVGLCQIGAAVMASRGYNYKQILSHYYPGSSLERQSDM